MDRILRPGGWGIIRDKVEILDPLEKILRSLHWEIRMTFAKDKEGILCAQKTMWRPWWMLRSKSSDYLDYRFQSFSCWLSIHSAILANNCVPCSHIAKEIVVDPEFRRCEYWVRKCIQRFNSLLDHLWKESIFQQLVCNILLSLTYLIQCLFILNYLIFTDEGKGREG